MKQSLESAFQESVDKNVKLIYQNDVLKQQRDALFRINRKLLAQMNRAAKKLHDPQAVAVLSEVESQMKQIQAEIRELEKSK